MRLRTLALLTGAFLSLPSQAQAQDVYQLHEMTIEEAENTLSEREIIIKFTDPAVLQGLYTTPTLQRLENAKQADVAQIYANYLASHSEEQQALKILSEISEQTGIALKAKHTLRHYGLFGVGRSDLEDDTLVETLFNHPLIEEVQINTPLRISANTTRSSQRVQSGGVDLQSINPNASSDPYYQNQTVFYEQGANTHGAASVEKAREALAQYANISGNKVNVAIISSGATPHEDITWEQGYNFITDEIGGWDSYPVEDESGAITNKVTGLGLAEASIIGAKNDNGQGIKGILPADNVRLFPAAAVNSYTGSTFDIYRAILWAVAADDILNDPAIPLIEHKADVLALNVSSFAGCGNYEYSSLLQEAVDIAANNNAVMVAQAGDDSHLAENNSPSNCNNVITVGGVDVYGEPTASTNFGSPIDAMALGHNVFTAVKDSDEYKETEHTGYAPNDGTNYAASIVAAQAAWIKLIDKTLAPVEVESIVKRTATPLTTSTDNNFLHACVELGCGFGSINFERTVNDFYAPMQNAIFEAEHYLTTMSKNVTATDIPLFDELLEQSSCDAYVLRRAIKSDFSYRIFGGDSSDITVETGELVATVDQDSYVLLDRSAYPYFIAEATHNSGESVVKPINFIDQTIPQFCQ